MFEKVQNGLLKVIVFSLLSHGSFSWAQFTLPRLRTTQEVSEFSSRLALVGPWTARIAANLPVIATVVAKLVPQLEALPEWQQLAQLRGPAVHLRVDKVEMQERQISLPRPEVEERWRAEIAAVKSELRARGEASAVENLRLELTWLAQHEARGLITGLINALPPERRAEVFAQSQVRSQLTTLRDSAFLTDEALIASFRPEIFGIERDQVSKVNLLALAEESLQREEQITRMLRTAWFEWSNELDPFHATAERWELFTEGLNLKGRALGYAKKLVKVRAAPNDSDYYMGMKNVEVVKSSIFIEEVSPEVGLTRGGLMQDCSTYAYAFALSPQEHVYLIKNGANEPLGFAVATAVEAEGLKTLFVHDIGGAGVTIEIAGAVVHAFQAALPQLGFAQLTPSTQNGNLGGWTNWSNKIMLFPKQVKQNYLDRQIRSLVTKASNYSYYYDLPDSATNAQARVFVADQNFFANFRLHVEGSGNSGTQPAVASKPQAILQAITLYNANPESGISPAMLGLEGIQARDLYPLFEKLKNARRLPLQTYYGELEEIFAKYEIRLTRNFIRDHDFVFWEGHLKASDSLTTTDSTYLGRTVKYIILSLKRSPKPDTALALIHDNMDFFLQNEAFQNYLHSFTGRGEFEAARIEDLRKLGFDLGFLLNQADVRARLIEGSKASVRHWALAEAEPQSLPLESVRLIAHDLISDDEDIARAASKILLRTDKFDRLVIDGLKKSVEDADERDIALRSLVALSHAVPLTPKQIARLRKHVDNVELDGELRERIQLILSALPLAAPDCETALRSGAVPPPKPRA